MAIKIKTIDDLSRYIEYLPTAVIQDIDKRITDWLSSRGTLEDSYIKQQLRFAENVLNLKHA